jgi:hypothetical protein
VPLDRALRDPEALPDRAVGRPVRDQFGDLGLAPGQRAERPPSRRGGEGQPIGGRLVQRKRAAGGAGCIGGDRPERARGWLQPAVQLGAVDAGEPEARRRPLLLGRAGEAERALGVASPRWYPVIGFLGAATVAGIVSTAFKPGPLPGFGALAIENPVAVAGAGSLLGALQQVGLVCFAVGMVAAAGSLVARLRSARGDERQQVKWVAYAPSSTRWDSPPIS